MDDPFQVNLHEAHLIQDGDGTSSGKTKPAPLLRINHSGTFKDTIIKNAPARSIAIGGASIVVDTVTVDNGTFLPFS